MEKVAMETVRVISPVQDNDLRTNLKNSPIWKEAYTETELAIASKKHTELYEYSIKFEGLKPMQLTGVKKLAK